MALFVPHAGQAFVLGARARPFPGHVQANVVSHCHQRQILDGIVSLVAVDMMHNLGSQKGSAKVLFHDGAMLQFRSAARQAESNITPRLDIPAAFPHSRFLTHESATTLLTGACARTTRLGAYHIRRSPHERGPALRANEDNAMQAGQRAACTRTEARTPPLDIIGLRQKWVSALFACSRGDTLLRHGINPLVSGRGRRKRCPAFPCLHRHFTMRGGD
jgi:hypothetical protein